jgi:hypothetical protein
MPLGYKPNTVRESIIAALEALRHPKAKRGKKLKRCGTQRRESKALTTERTEQDGVRRRNKGVTPKRRWGTSGNMIGANLMKQLIWGAGAVHVGIVLANVPLVGRLRVGERLAGVPRFLRQIVYVHWAYILIVVGLFAALCFGFASELAGGSGLGRFLSGFMAGFWLLRIVLQVFYYDQELRRENRGMDLLYVGSLVGLVGIFGMAVLR